VNPETAAALFDMIHASPDLAGAVCTDPVVRELFDSTTVGWCAADVLDEAIGTCGRCPAIQPCRAWVEGLAPRRRPRGVVGGLVVASRSGRVLA
jgi:hypothetical protein